MTGGLNEKSTLEIAECGFDGGSLTQLVEIGLFVLEVGEEADEGLDRLLWVE